jgi:hypothetical protein
MGRIIHLSVLSVLLLLCASLLPIQANAGWSHDPAVNTAITTQVGADTNPAVIADGAGGAIIAWMDPAKDIRVQKIDANANLLWGANGKAVTSNGDNYYPKLASDGSGGAIIAWQDGSEGSGIYVQRVNADGIPQWDTGGVIIILNNEQTTGNHQFPRIVSDGSGGAIIAWQDSRNGDFDIYAQWIDADAFELLVGGGIEICLEEGNQLNPQLISDGEPESDKDWAIITWQDGRNGLDIYAQKLTRVFKDEEYSFTLEWEPEEPGGTPVTSDPDTQHMNPRLVSDGSGGAIISWQDNRTLSNDYKNGIYAQRVGEDGSTQWENDLTVCDLTGDQVNPEMTGDGSGGAIISWWDFRDGANFAINAQRINGSGTALWTPNGVAVATPANIDTSNYSPQIAGDGSNGAVITWADQRNGTDENIYAQRITAGGIVSWPTDGVAVTTATNNQQQPRLINAGSGEFIITWQDGRGDGDIYAQKVLADGTYPIVSPTVTTAAIPIITATSATSGGNVTSDGGSAVTARGVCWGASPDPVTGGNCISTGSGVGSFTGVITGLTPTTPYHLRAYATNAIGTAYGSDIPFTTINKYGLNLTFAGNGSGIVKSGSSSCGSACTFLVNPNATAPLQATPDPYYLFTSWSGACSGTSPSCTVQMTADNKNVVATFTLDAANSVRVTLPTEKRYASISDAIRLDADGTAVIDAWGCALAESPIFNRGAFTLKGGWNQAYNSQSGTTTIIGTLTVQSGSVTVENLAIR